MDAELAPFRKCSIDTHGCWLEDKYIVHQRNSYSISISEETCEEEALLRHLLPALHFPRLNQS